MAQDERLKKKLQQLGLSATAGPVEVKGKFHFRIFFPKNPYDGLQLRAAKQGQGYNFTGQLLGIGGATLRKIKHLSGAKIEVVNADGNLNGAHPNPLDPHLHALIIADSQSALQNAAQLIWTELSPLNAAFKPITAVPGGSVTLTVERPSGAAAEASVPPLMTAALPSVTKAVPKVKIVARPFMAKAAAKQQSKGLTAKGPKLMLQARAAAGPAPAINTAAPPSAAPAVFSALLTEAPVAAAAPAAGPSVPAVNSRTSIHSLFANLEGFSFSGASQDASSTGDAGQTIDSTHDHDQQQAAGPRSACSKAAAGYSVAPPAAAGAAARASFLLSQLGSPPPTSKSNGVAVPLAASAFTPAPATAAASSAAALSKPSMAPAAGVAAQGFGGFAHPPLSHHQQQQQQLHGGLMAHTPLHASPEPVSAAPMLGPRGFDGGPLGFGLPASLLRDLSLDDESAYSMAGSRLSGPGGAGGAAAHMQPQQQLQHVLQMAPVSSYPAYEAQPQHLLHQAPHLQQLPQELYSSSSGGSQISADPAGVMAGSLAYHQHQRQGTALSQHLGTHMVANGHNHSWLAGASLAAGLPRTPGFGTDALGGLVGGAGAGVGDAGGHAGICLGHVAPGSLAYGEGLPGAGTMQYHKLHGAPPAHKEVQVVEEPDDYVDLLKLLNVRVD